MLDSVIIEETYQRRVREDLGVAVNEDLAAFAGAARRLAQTWLDRGVCERERLRGDRSVLLTDAEVAARLEEWAVEAVLDGLNADGRAARKSLVDVTL